MEVKGENDEKYTKEGSEREGGDGSVEERR
jgi:hypothetical protein